MLKEIAPDFNCPTVLFGGSFDPVHNGHLQLALTCCAFLEKQLGEIPQIVFLPCSQNPQKDAVQATPDMRLHFLRLAIGVNKALQLWDYEAHKKEPSFTIHTLEKAHELGAKKQNLFLLLGADLYLNLHTWKQQEKFRNYARIIVGNRPGSHISQKNPEDILFTMPPIELSSHALRAELSQKKIPKGAFPEALEEEFRLLFLNSTNPYAK